jgi:hypothetical protein
VQLPVRGVAVQFLESCVTLHEHTYRGQEAVDRLRANPNRARERR